MHRVNTKRRQKAILRTVTYGLMISLTVVTTAVLLYAALGYRINKTGEVVRNGLLLVDSQPVAADIYLNGRNMQDPTSSRFVLPTGNYLMQLKQTGYRDWSKPLDIDPSQVENIYYPLLIPTKLGTLTSLRVTKPQIVSQSLDRKKLFIYSSSQSAPEIINLSKQNFKTTTLTLPATISQKNGSLGNLKAIEWSQDSHLVLAWQTLPGGSKHLLKIDVNNPAQSMDITSLFGSKTPLDVKFQINNNNAIYGVYRGQLNLYNLKTKVISPLLNKVYQYQPYDKDTFSFVVASADGKSLQAGIYKNNLTAIIHQTPIAKGNSFSAFGNFDSSSYLAVQLPGEKTVTVYSNPLRTPILAKQLPFVILKNQNNLKQLEFSPDGRFLLARNPANASVYNFEINRKTSFKLKPDLTEMSWSDSHHFVYQFANSQSATSDYDGYNYYNLIKVAAGGFWFANDYRTGYAITADHSKTNLVALKLVL